MFLRNSKRWCNQGRGNRLPFPAHASPWPQCNPQTQASSRTVSHLCLFRGGGPRGPTSSYEITSDDDGRRGHGLLFLGMFLGMVYICLILAASMLFDSCHRVLGNPPAASHASISVIIPALNEQKCIGSCIRNLLLLGSFLEIIVVDGGSTDRTLSEAKRAGARVIRARKGRGSQMNAGAEIARGDILLFLHADTSISDTAADAIRDAFSDGRTILVGLRPSIEVEGRQFSILSFHNMIKTWYGPLIFRPLSYIRGLRLLFGDQALSCRAKDFRALGGFNDRLPIMEDADLCLRMHEGNKRVKMLLNEVAVTSGRRFAVWGTLRATYIHFLISVKWYLGSSYEELHRLYIKYYTDSIR